MTDISESLQDREDSYDVLDDGTVVPISDTVINEIVNNQDINLEEINTEINNHQEDLHSGGTVFAYINRMLSTGECQWFYCTDQAVYLGVDSGVWEREKEWLCCDSSLVNALKEAHRKEMKWVAERVSDGLPSNIADGYVVGIHFPLASTAQHPEIKTPALSLAERAEFVHRDVGIDSKHASSYVIYEWLKDNEKTSEEAIRILTEVFERDQERILDGVESVKLWQNNIENIVEKMEDEVGKFERVDSDIFGAVAALQNDT